jgi:hypothetical protein
MTGVAPGMGRDRIILCTMSFSPPVAIAQGIFLRDKALRSEFEPGKDLREDSIFEISLVQLFEPLFRPISKRSAGFLEGCLDEQFAAHSNAAMKKGIRNLKAFVAQRESPGQYMLIVAIQ